ncbi:MAG: 2Fe-2S iron-sulfur cluster binding domain-containing protein, partial [Myxococcales bacterium]|nr:2Fe-2S iron-sulfur cluster binding domain-containing protein [Myxococcales bacterium]
VPPGSTILDAGLAAGVPMEFSCAMGGCGACAVDLRDGEVELDEPNCLSPEERARGRILACVARPMSPCTVVVPR